MNKLTIRKKQGFTLIEILVVVAVISILSSGVLFNILQARGSARDDIRISDLKRMQLAIEMYKSEVGRYPAGCRTAAVPNNWGGNGAGAYKCTGDLIVGLKPDYISSLPLDPNASNLISSKGYLYQTNSTGTEYKLMVNGSVEVKKISSYAQEYARCPSKGIIGCTASKPPLDTYAVYSGSTAATW